ncbi:DUF5011 domain-containing protein [Cellulomonas triticagri]|uniref:DUF5011 domain-containing protein n=2 Tax=Cellulomonas triticagri TaxID=2483352 RepID=A0A3M2J4Q1_9CELL|nr:DUF5011 domain-containing protein [Cellulomonas triticagri]
MAALAAGGLATTAEHADAATYPATFLDGTTTWRYSDDGSDPAAGDPDRLVWTAGDYDDAAWKSGTGGFGAKRGAASGIGPYTAVTLLNQYLNGTGVPNVPTFHFRSEFDLTGEQVDDLASLRGTVVYDDAVQIFVNGTQVAGFLDDKVVAAPEAERNQMYAGANNGDPVSSTFSVPVSALHEGTNTIAAAVYQTNDDSSDIYFDVTALTAVAADAPTVLSDVVLSIGADASQRSVTWYSDTDTAQVVQVAPASVATGGAFPEAAARTITATGAATTSGEFNRRATLDGLAENTAYVYRVGSATGGWSATSEFRTQDFSGDYDFLFVGDPQIGASGNVANDQAGWTDTLDLAEATYPDAELIFSAGDQVESAGNEAHYDAFLAPDQLREIPLVPVNGNHDVGSKAYEQHYTVPNLDPTAGAAGSATASGGDYWFEYKDVLFMVINSNSGDTTSHQAFLERVVAEHGDDATWKVLAFHHSIYSVAAHVNDTQIRDLRAALPTIISDLDIDLVLQGHDHSYTRSYLIEDGVLADPAETAAQGTVTAADGEVLYVTANSASGSKYYDVQAPDAWYASVINQEKVRNYSHVAVTDDSITVTTLRSQANGTGSPVNSVVDEVTLRRADTTPPVLTVPADGTVTQGADFDPMTGVTAVDAVDGDLTAQVAVTGAVDTAVLGAQTLTYRVADAAGNEATATRTVTVTAAAAFHQDVAPALSARSARVGQPLTADAGTWTPEPTAVAFQWLRDGSAIAGATAATYTPVAADLGTALSARITVSRAGLPDAVAVTDPVTVGAAVAAPGDGTPVAGGTGGTGSSGGGGSLATTGFTVGTALALAVALLVGGGLAVRHSRRRAA